MRSVGPQRSNHGALILGTRSGDGRIEIEVAAGRGLLKQGIQRSVVLLVVVCPLLALCWRLGEDPSFGRLSLAVYVAVALLLIVCERFLAFDTGWGSAIRGNRTDFLYVIVATGIEKVSFVACVTAVAALGRQLAGALGVDLWPSHWSFGLQVIAALLIADAGAYFRHRLSHRLPVLWRFHQIHHSVEGLYWIRSAYTHPVEQLLIMIAIMLPIAFLGASNQVIAVVAFLFALSGLVQHANVDARSSFLNRLFATPEVHRIHHRADELGNRSNFSAFFVLMDHLFGSYVRPSPADGRIRVGLEGVADFPGDFLSHLVMPFQRDVGRVAAGDAWRPATQPKLPSLKDPQASVQIE